MVLEHTGSQELGMEGLVGWTAGSLANSTQSVLRSDTSGVCSVDTTDQCCAVALMPCRTSWRKAGERAKGRGITQI